MGKMPSIEDMLFLDSDCPIKTCASKNAVIVLSANRFIAISAYMSLSENTECIY